MSKPKLKIPEISKKDKEINLLNAFNSKRKRHALILHKKGAYFNEAVNFIYSSSYMIPHQHNADEKSEFIYLIEGNITILYFKDNGEITKKHVLNDKDKRYINVPPYTWHTYVVNSNYAITYETMNGIYDPISWKHFANWAPKELSNEASLFLEFLKSNSQKHFA